MDGIEHPLTVHLGNDAEFMVLTPMPEGVLGSVVFVSRLKKSTTFPYTVREVTKRSKLFIVIDVYLSQPVAAKVSQHKIYLSEPEQMTVRELLQKADEGYVGIDLHFRDDEAAFRKAHAGDVNELNQTSLLVSNKIIADYHDFVLQEIPAPQTHIAMMREMDKSDATLTDAQIERVYESFKTIKREMDLDLYFIKRLGRPTIVVDITAVMWKNKGFQKEVTAVIEKLGEDIGVEFFPVVCGPEEPKRSDRHIPVVGKPEKGRGKNKPALVLPGLGTREAGVDLDVLNVRSRSLNLP
ncbi:MAG TPA: hypothetical protein PKB15_02925 [Acidimicrobiia bacterium]|nr:hypothetical protein [Acidimicrobiia bacterium]